MTPFENLYDRSILTHVDVHPLEMASVLGQDEQIPPSIILNSALRNFLNDVSLPINSLLHNKCYCFVYTLFDLFYFLIQREYNSST